MAKNKNKRLAVEDSWTFIKLPTQMILLHELVKQPKANMQAMNVANE